jgi:hypothetical protein
MEMKYMVIQKYYDTGRTSASIVSIDDNDPRVKADGYHKEHSTFDEYIDIFDTEHEAEQFRKDTLNT